MNVIDTRIPRRLPENAVGVEALAGYGSAADERLLNGSVDVPIAGKFVFHVDGNWTKTDDLHTGGHILSKDLREEAPPVPTRTFERSPTLRETSRIRRPRLRRCGRVRLRRWRPERRRIDHSPSLQYTRCRSAIRSNQGSKPKRRRSTRNRRATTSARKSRSAGSSARSRVGPAIPTTITTSWKSSGEVGSSFFSKGGEGRVELVQSERSGWGGTSGLQYLDRNAKIRGAEKFLPDSEQRQTGLFTLQTFVDGPLRVEGGGRVEFSELTAHEDEQLETPAHSRNFTTWSASLGGKYEFTPGWRAGLTFSRSSRAPSIDELFANGPHGGSQSFEIGNPDLDPENSLSVEAALTGDAGPVTLTTNVYYSHFSNFIFQAPTGEIEEDLPVFETRQGRANYYGFEAQALAKFGEALGIHWKGELQADMVHATVKDFGPAPLIPPLRILGALEGSHGPVDGRVEVEHAFDHDRTAPIETQTPGYTVVNASVDWHVYSANPELTLSLAANNLFEVDARRSTSMLKDYAPLGGRDIRLTARVGF